MKSIFSFLLLLSFFSLWACRQHSPEKLPKLKERFKSQIASFDEEKQETNELVTKALDGITALQDAINNSRKVDKEFNRVYGNWEKVNKKVNSLNEEYEMLRKRADTLFAAIDRQISSLRDEKSKTDLKAALEKSRMEYNKTLQNTSVAIEKLRKLHTEAVDIIKALEAAVAIGQIAKINEGLKSIEGRVDDIMKELNTTVEESKNLYNHKIGEVS
jgi:chromosome segregation ATPase